MSLLKHSLDKAKEESQSIVILIDRIQDLVKLQQSYLNQTDVFGGDTNYSATFLEGHTGSKREGQEWADVVSCRRALFTTSLSLLHALQHGFVNLRHVNRILCLDNVPDAANQHPLCLIMQLFYWPLLGMNFAEASTWDPFPIITGFVLVEDEQIDLDNVFKRHCWVERLQHYFQFYDALIINTLNALHLDNVPCVLLNNSLVDISFNFNDTNEKCCNHGERDIIDANVLSFEQFAQNIHQGSFRKWTIINASLQYVCELAKACSRIHQNQPSDINSVLECEGSLDVIGYRFKRTSNDPLIAQSSLRHFRTATGALLEPTLSIDVLLCFCSSLPKVRVGGRKKAKGLTICTVPVRRLDAHSEHVACADKSEGQKCWFACRIVLPQQLSAFMECQIDGPAMHSRHEAQAEATFVACLQLLKHKFLDAHLFINDYLTNVDDQKVESSIEEEGIDEDIVLADASKDLPMEELIPLPLQGCPAWRGKYVYAVEWKWACPTHATANHLPMLTRWLQAIVDYMNSAQGPVGFAVVFREALPTTLPPIFIPTGSCLSGQVAASEGEVATQQPGFTFTLKLIGELEEEEHFRLLEMQPKIFSFLNVRPLFLEDLDKSIDLLNKPWIPDDKRSVYMLAPLIRQGYQYESFNVDRLYSLYEAMKQGRTKHVHQDYSNLPWLVDWEFVQRIYSPDSPFVSQVFDSHFSRFSHLLDANVFIELCLKQALLVSPHDGMCHQLRKLYPLLTPNSPFTSKGIKKAKTYWEYVKIKHNIDMKPTEVELNQGPLLGVCRVENFADVSRWTLCNPSDDHQFLMPTTSSDKTKLERGDNLEDKKMLNSKTALIPWLTRISDLPYATIRALLLMPRVCGELEAHLLTLDYYTMLSLKGFTPQIPVDSCSAASLISSLTVATAMQSDNYERLEILGDSILKVAVTLDVLARNGVFEGRLTNQRTSKISNSNLSRIGKCLHVHKYAHITPFHPKLWTPPSLNPRCKESDELEKAHIQRLFDPEARWKLLAGLQKKRINRETVYDYVDDHIVTPSHRMNRSKTSLSRLGQQISEKTVADLVEASIGAVYMVFGWDSCMMYLQKLAIIECNKICRMDPLDLLGRLSQDPNEQSATKRGKQGQTCGKDPPKSLLDVFKEKMSNDDNKINANDYGKIEASLSYKFKERALLCAALTHKSMDSMYCNERLEWLGDALIDWSVTKYYYRFASPQMTPFELTEVRKATVNNIALSELAVTFGLQEYIQIDSAELAMEITSYIQYLKSRDVHNDGTAIPPKALGDLFEAVVGAIFLDMDLDFVSLDSLICSHLMSSLLNKYTNPGNLPLNVISRCLQSYAKMGVASNDLQFIFANQDGREHCRVIVRGRVVGEAEVTRKYEKMPHAKALAKEKAAQAALDYLLNHGII